MEGEEEEDGELMAVRRPVSKLGWIESKLGQGGLWAW